MAPAAVELYTAKEIAQAAGVPLDHVVRLMRRNTCVTEKRFGLASTWFARFEGSGGFRRFQRFGGFTRFGRFGGFARFSHTNTYNVGR